jgi:glycosyltransferase involved in cell wall biosynthesis
LLQAAMAQRWDASPLKVTAIQHAASDVDAIHAHDARSHTLAAFTSRPTIVSRRVAFPVRRGIPSRWKYGRARHYIAVSNFVKQTLLDADVPPDRITVVYDGVPLNPSLPKSLDRSGVLAMDSDDPLKGKDTIERAAALADVPVHFSRDMARDLPLAAVFVYITELEGLGSAILLAMSAGAPVVASNVGGVPEIIENDVTGLLVPNDPRAVARGIQHMLTDRTMAVRVAAAARTRVERDFSIERMVKETIRVYERVLG